MEKEHMLEYEKPWPMAEHDQLHFYHTMTFPDGETCAGHWTLPDINTYLGSYDINGKTVLDVGTASGYIAFNVEKAGASEVTGLDMKSQRSEFRFVPFAQNMLDVHSTLDAWEAGLIQQKKAWWYGWYKFKSKAHCIYAPIIDLYESKKMYDVVIAGALLEHISDPVYAIGALAQVAREAIILPFTNVLPDEDMCMKPWTDWENPDLFFTWWKLSVGLYRRIFDNLNFDVSFDKKSKATCNIPKYAGIDERPTIIARRRT